MPAFLGSHDPDRPLLNSALAYIFYNVYIDNVENIITVAQNMGRASLGEFEHLVLAAVLRLRPNAYGMTIRLEIFERTGQDASIGAVYTTLERLKKKGFVSTHVGEATPERGGRRKKYFEITSLGVGAIEDAAGRLSSMWDGILTPKPVSLS